MRKELLVILVNKVVDRKRIIGKKWRAKKEDRHKGSLTPQKILAIRECKNLHYIRVANLSRFSWAVSIISQQSIPIF
jgi:hypothetical protein